MYRYCELSVKLNLPATNKVISGQTYFNEHFLKLFSATIRLASS